MYPRRSAAHLATVAALCGLGVTREGAARRSCVQPAQVASPWRGSPPEPRSGDRCAGILLRVELAASVVNAGPLQFTDELHRSFAGAALPDPMLVGVGPSFDFGMQFLPHFYFGINVEMLSFRLRAPLVAALPEWTTVTFTSASHFQVGGVFGVAFAAGPVAFRANVTLGYQSLTLRGTLQQGELPTGASATAPELLLRPRGAVDWFFVPFLSLQAELGVDVATHFALTGTLSLAVHTLWYDGLYARWP